MKLLVHLWQYLAESLMRNISDKRTVKIKTHIFMFNNFF